MVENFQPQDQFAQKITKMLEQPIPLPSIPPIVAEGTQVVQLLLKQLKQLVMEPPQQKPSTTQQPQASRFPTQPQPSGLRP
jgi:hypothetical protein